MVHEDSDDENYTSLPIFDTIYNARGSSAVLQMKKFSLSKIISFWDTLETDYRQHVI